jgi:hypothetical protein
MQVFEAQEPPAHVSEQQSASVAQSSPGERQNAGVVHVDPAHTAEQQVPPVVHAAPSPPHAGAGGAVQVFAPTAPEQVPLQHSVSIVHAAFSTMHWVCGSEQWPLAQLPVQQSPGTEQVTPTALHCAGSTQAVPSHAPEQQSEGASQSAASGWHCGSTMGAGSDPPPPHATASESAASAAARRENERMAASWGSRRPPSHHILEKPICGGHLRRRPEWV